MNNDTPAPTPAQLDLFEQDVLVRARKVRFLMLRTLAEYLRDLPNGTNTDALAGIVGLAAAYGSAVALMMGSLAKIKGFDAVQIYGMLDEIARMSARLNTPGGNGIPTGGTPAPTDGELTPEQLAAFGDALRAALGKK